MTIIMILNKLLPPLVVVCLVPSQLAATATAFVLAPGNGRSTTSHRRTHDNNSSSNSNSNSSSHPNDSSALNSLPKNKKKSGFKSFSSSFPDPTKDDNNSVQQQQQQQEQPPMKNDLSMFLMMQEEEEDDDDDDDTHGLSVSEELEFFVTQDESIQRLEEVEGLFRNNVAPDVRNNNNFGVAVVATQQKNTERKPPPERFGAVKMTDNNGIGVDQDSPSKKLIYYQYEGTLSKIRRNLYNNPYNEYSE